MKHSTPSKAKFKKLRRRLKLTLAETVGHLELLWHCAITNAPRGDIGCLDNETIAIECDYQGDPDEFVQQLVDCGWVDVCATYRLVIHDWPDHCPAFVKGNLKNKKLEFCTSSVPDPKSHTIVPDPGSPNIVPDLSGGSPNLTKPNLTKRNLTKPLSKTAAQSSHPPEVGRLDFEHWWELYPKRNGRRVGKVKCRRLFAKIKASELQDLKTATEHYAAECTDGYHRDPERFLRVWQDYVEPATAPGPTNGKTERDQRWERKRESLLKTLGVETE